jgi:N-acetylmuramic acid 6-phosphate etherase
MKPITEQVNPRSTDIDRRSTLEILTIINQEDKIVAEAVSQVLDRVAEAVDLIVKRLETGGRLFYVGSGTSGRLGVLDASECPPTFGVSPDLVQGIIAGGYEALQKAIEGAEDDYDQAAGDLKRFDVRSGDAVVGISASGNTPYTLGAVEYAMQMGAATIAVTCNPDSKMAAAAGVSISPVVGAEVLAGSSRMKAGTAQKMVLNMISTATMIRRGLVYSNLMSNLKATNEKLRGRAGAILAEETRLEPEAAARALEEAGNDLRVALLMVRARLSRDDAESLLNLHGGSVRRGLDNLA